MRLSSKTPIARRAFASKHNGFALIVVVLLLIALSMVGIASLRGVTLQEKMAGNLYFRALAFAEAESALRATVAKIDSKVGLTVETPATPEPSDPDWKPLLASGSNQSYWGSDSGWINTASRSVMSTTAAGLQINATTEQIIPSGKQMPSCDDKMLPGPCDVMFTRMTARAVDPTTGAAVVVQQFWSYPISK